MNVSFTTNVERVLANLDERYHKQLPFAVALALNRTAEEMQVAAQNRIRQRGFTIRSAQTDAWLTRQVMINRGDRATKDRLRAAVSIGMGFSSASKSLLPFLEGGGTRTSRMQIGNSGIFAAGTVAVPIRSSPMQIMPRGLYPSALGLQEVRAIDGGTYRAGRGQHSRRKVSQRVRGMLMKGSMRTFLIKTSQGKGVLLQREGSSKGRRVQGARDPNTKALFAIVPFTRVAGRKFFFSSTLPVANARFRINLTGFLSHAIRTAK